MTPLFKSVAEAPHSRTRVHRAHTLAQAWSPGGTNTRLAPQRSLGSAFGVRAGPTCKRCQGLLGAWGGLAGLSLPLCRQLPGRGSGGPRVSGRQQGSPCPPWAGTTVPSRPRPLLRGASGFCPQDTFKSEGKGMNRTSVTAAGREVANDIRLPPLLPILRSPRPGWAPLLV